MFKCLLFKKKITSLLMLSSKYQIKKIIIGVDPDYIYYTDT